MGVTYHTGALIAADRGERLMWARHRALLMMARLVPSVRSPLALRSILGAVHGKDRGMTDNVPVSRTDGPAESGDVQGPGAVSGATARKIDPAELGTAFSRTRHVLTLEFGDRKDFDDPRREWRRLFSEMLGTFALVLVAAGGGLLHAKGQISLAAAVVAPGVMVTAIILFMGAVSGAHLNPAVSLAFALRGDFPWKRVPGYIIIQLVGATRSEEHTSELQSRSD